MKFCPIKQFIIYKKINIVTKNAKENEFCSLLFIYSIKLQFNINSVSCNIISFDGFVQQSQKYWYLLDGIAYKYANISTDVSNERLKCVCLNLFYFLEQL